MDDHRCFALVSHHTPLFGSLIIKTVKLQSTVRLNQSDWVLAAIATLVAEGIDAVQITRLARDLKVSRGSFYWHFDDRAALLQQVLIAWKSSNSHAVQHTLKASSSLSQGILEFFGLWVDRSAFNPELEQAVRDWARLDDAVMRAVHSEDENRIEDISLFYQRFDYLRDDAFVRARVLYFAQIGYYALHITENMRARLHYTELYFESFTGRKIDSAALASFKKRYEVKD